GTGVPVVVAKDVFRPDVGLEARLAAHLADLQGGVADGVVGGKAGDVLVDPHEEAPPRCWLRGRLPLPGPLPGRRSRPPGAEPVLAGWLRPPGVPAGRLAAVDFP